MSICSIEDVAEAVEKPFWFQLYVMRDRGFVRSLIERAAAAKCSALVLTVDLQVLGQRHCDIKNGLAVPPQLKLKNLINMATRPGWVLSVLAGKRWTFGNLAGHVKGMEGVTSLAQWTNEQFDPTLNWKDVEWIKKIWPGKLILKGILDLDDAKAAVKLGADAIVVSNHGGRQLDGASSSISMLPAIVDAVGSDTEVLFDGGIRTGADIMRALALGARLPDRPRLYLRARRRRPSRRRQGDRHPGKGTQRRHGADRHQIDRRHRRPQVLADFPLRNDIEAGKAAQAPLMSSQCCR